jgi:predicted ATPase/DNA-binding CsgD family transcriptional regulator
VAAVLEMQRALQAHAWPAGERVRVRMGVHVGEASRAAAGLVGLEVHRAARVAAVGYGGQVLVSETAAALVRDRLPPGASLADLGLHRLKDLGRPERIFQLQAAGLQAGFPQLRSLGNPALANNLPAQLSSFIGRDAELAAVSDLVAASRLVTLTGAGGAGKTRLALQVAAGLAGGARDGVWFADLAPLRDPDLVARTVADVLGVREEPGRPVLEALVEAVGKRSLLVLLDNCEHVIGACAKLADALLRGCPSLALLATSREPLGIGGEQVHRVPSMGVPAEGEDAGVIRAREAVRLLADRAAAQGVPLAWDQPSAEVVGRICRRLDGIPLAIELAAARLRVMPPAELEARLDERFVLLTGGSRAGIERQQTLRALVDWSWELLNPSERAVLARLSAFAGSFGLAAAEAVAAGPDVPQGEVAGHLGGLVDKSLVQFGDAGAGPGRYRLLETVRQYAAGRLDAQGPPAVNHARIAHRDYYTALAEVAAPQLRAADQAEWLDRLDAELGNLRAAVAFSLTQADLTPGLVLAASLRAYWVHRHAAEGADVLRALLDAPAAQGTTLVRAEALAAAAAVLERTGGYATAGDYCEEGLAIARAVGDDYLVADLLHERAAVLLRQGPPGAARPLIEQALGLARRLGEPYLTGRLLAGRSYAEYVEGDPAGAARDAAESLRLFRQAGDWLQAGQMLGNLGNYELMADDLDAARRHLAESLDIARALNARDGIAYETFNLGLAEYLGGSPGTAEALFAESLDLARRTGMKMNMAYALVGLALAGRGGADPGWSARLHGAADQALAELGHTLAPLEARLAGLDRRRLRDAMGDTAFDAEYAAGRTLDVARVLMSATDTAASDGAAPAAQPLPDPLARFGLTAREREVLSLLAVGRSNPEIAQALSISTKTASVHVSNILAKLGVSGRVEAAAVAHRLGVYGRAARY